MVTVKLDKFEAAALEIVAKSEGMTAEHLLRDLIRDAAIHLVTGRPRRYPGGVKVESDTNMPIQEKSEGDGDELKK